MSETSVAVVSTYHFQTIEKPYLIKAKLSDWTEGKDIKGTLIIAPEGVNGTLSGPRRVLEGFVAELANLLGVESLSAKWAETSRHPFGKLKFPLKNEVITMGAPKPNPLERVGTYVEPGEWNEIISDPEVTLVDTRNWYEFDIGTFKGALDPRIDAFRDFEGWVEEHLDPKAHKKVAMFCTGGIRCEKASSYMLDRGFESVYHLKGGILNYLEQVPEKSSMWEGECFVFDDRVSVNHDLEPGTSIMCRSCGCPNVNSGFESGQTHCESCGALLTPRASTQRP